MEMPAGFEVPGMVCRLKKSLYGLKQSPRNWYLLISAFIKEELGFKACISDPCLFTKTSETGTADPLFLFVDDMQVAFDSADEKEWDSAHQQLKNRFNITRPGREPTSCSECGSVETDGHARITLDQELYITKALEKFGLSRLQHIERTPAVTSAVVKAGG